MKIIYLQNPREYKVHAKRKPSKYTVTETLCKSKYSEPCSSDISEITCQKCLNILSKTNKKPNPNHISSFKENPYKSKAQQRLFHALAATGKISPDMVAEYDKESAGLDLPERVGNPNKSYPSIKTTKDIFKPNQYNKNWYAVKVNQDIQVNLSLSQDGKDYYISFSKGLMPLNEAVEKNWIASYSKKYDSLKEVKQYLVDYANHYLAYEYFPKDVYLYD